MFRGGPPREESVADETPAHVLTNDDEHLTELVAPRGACACLDVFVSSHVDWQSCSASASVSLAVNESQTYKFVTSVPRLYSTAQPQRNQQREAAAA
jgi:hypothetical protein